MAGQLLTGKVAVVTGAGRGLGRAHALALAARGAAVLVNDVDGPSAAATADTIRAGGGRAEPDATSVSTIAAGARVVEHAAEVFGGVDVVVNNAGISRRAPVEDLDDDTVDAHLGVHLKATMGTTKAAFSIMRPGGGGRIVNTVSGAGLYSEYGGVGAYGSAKGAVYAFTRVAAIEGAPHGIFVNAISPLALTPMSERFVGTRGDIDPELLRPERVAQLVVFLATPLARDLTGRVLRLAGRDLGEVVMETGPVVSADRWTPELIATRLGEVVDARART